MLQDLYALAVASLYNPLCLALIVCAAALCIAACGSARQTVRR